MKTYEVWTTQGTHHRIEAEQFICRPANGAAEGWVEFHAAVRKPGSNEVQCFVETHRFNAAHVLYIHTVSS